MDEPGEVPLLASYADSIELYDLCENIHGWEKYGIKTGRVHIAHAQACYKKFGLFAEMRFTKIKVPPYSVDL